MVNGSSSKKERRKGERQADHGLLGSASLNPFGDLHTLQHLSARLARGMRGVFEPVLRRELRTWAEPLVVQKFADYRAERPEGLTAWLPMMMMPDNRSPVGAALAVFDGKFVLELLDLFFGGTGAAPADMPTEFTPAAEAVIGRIGAMLAEPLRNAWEPLVRLRFAPGHPEANAALLGDLDNDDAVVITRFGIGADHQKTIFIDLLYPVAALKPFAPSLTGKVHGKTAEPDPAWKAGLARAAMDVRFPVRSVLAESTISLSVLMDLKPGDVIPINVGADVPVIVGNDRIGVGTVGTSNGKAAIRLQTIRALEHGDV